MTGEAPTGAGSPPCSVVMPVHNGASTLRRSIDSVLAQTLTDIELIVVDDGSTDGSADVVASIDDTRVRLHRQPKGGVSAARNSGARRATGSYLAFLDCDDIARPTWLEVLSSTARREGASLVCASVEKVNPLPGEPAVRRPDRQSNGLHVLFLPGAYMVDRELFHTVGGFDEELGYSENVELGMRLQQACIASGLGVAWTDEVVATMDRSASGSSRPLRYAAVERILAVHEADFRQDRERHARWLGMAAVEATRHGDRRRALGYAARSIRVRPLQPRSWVRLASAAFPRWAQRRWGAYDSAATPRRDDRDATTSR